MNNDLEEIRKEVVALSIKLGDEKKEVEKEIKDFSYKQLVSLKTDLGMLIDWE